MDDETVLQLARDVSDRLWKVASGRSNDVHLILPLSSRDTDRVSEQESKIVFSQVLEERRLYYSIETPTRLQYRQSGTRPVGARLDLTVYSDPATRSRDLNVELKAGTPGVESFRKDFEKLAREGTPGLWFHTLERATERTVASVCAKMLRALSDVDMHTLTASHGITFAFCILDRRILLTGHLPLGEDVMSSSQSLLGPDGVGWTVEGASAELFVFPPESRHGIASARPGVRERRAATTGRQSLLLHLPEIADDTLLHFSSRGDSYRLRAFAGRLAGRSAWVHNGVVSATDFLAAVQPLASIDVSDVPFPLTDKGEWAKVVRVHNVRVGLER